MWLAFKIATVAMLLELPFAAAVIPDANLVLNLFMLLVILFGAPRFFKSTRAQAVATEKDRVITTHEQTIDALREKDAAVAAQLASAQEQTEVARTSSAAWEERFARQQEYTAGPAVNALQESLAADRALAAQRHGEMMMVLRDMARMAGDRRDPHGHGPSVDSER